MKKIWLAYRYIFYLFLAKTRYHIHSPFVFEFINSVLRDKTRYPEYKMPDRTLRKYKKRKDKIETIDFGKKSGNNDYIITQASVGSIVKTRSHTPGQLHLLFRISKFFKPTIILELGTAAGISTLYLASGSPGSKVVSLEGCVGLTEIAKKCFSKRNLENIEVLVGKFESTLPQVLQSAGTLDLVFFDGNHREGPTLNYFEQCLQYADENSVFIFDDIHWSPGMERAWEKIKKNVQVSLTIDLFWAGLVFFKKGIAKQDFIIRY